MAHTILIVDDEADLREILDFNLSRNGWQTLCASSAEEALEILERGERCSLMLLDVMMGGRSGFELLATLKERGYSIPTIFLTALDTQSDLLHGFSLGADDYIAKPFSVAEVVARVRAVLSRTPTPTPEICLGDITVNTETKKAQIGGQTILLTKTEFSLLEILMSHPCKIFSRDELLSRVWGSEVFVEPRTVDVHIARLRKKIEASELQLLSRSGYGYSIGQ